MIYHGEIGKTGAMLPDPLAEGMRAAILIGVIQPDLQGIVVRQRLEQIDEGRDPDPTRQQDQRLRDTRGTTKRPEGALASMRSPTRRSL